MDATVTDRHATVTRKLASVTVEKPCATRTYERAVAHRRDIPDIFTHAHARAHGNCLGAVATVATVCDGRRHSRKTFRYFRGDSSLKGPTEQGQ